MLCRTCHGHHWIIYQNQMQPCPECGGIGEVHCCDGLTAQREVCDLPPPAVHNPRSERESPARVAR
jgi:hypothetical protein